MALKHTDISELGDSKFISDLAFLCDLTSHLNNLNIHLQGRYQVITTMFDAIKSFKCKLLLWTAQLEILRIFHL